MPPFTDPQVNYEHLRTAVEAAGIGTWNANMVTGELVWSRRCKELFGLPADQEVSEEVFRRGIHPDDVARVEAAIRQAFDPEGPGIYESEFRTLHPESGQVLHWVRATGRVYYDENRNQPLRFIGTAADITAQRLRHLQLQRLHDSTMIGVLYWDLNQTCLIDANGEYLRMVGRTAAELAAGQIRWDEITPPEHRATDGQAMAELRRNGQHRPYTKEYLRPDGTRITVLIGGALVEPGSTFGISYCLDMTALREAERRSAAREREFRFLADTIPQIVWTADAAGNNTYLNKRWTNYTGLSLERSLGGDAWHAVLHPHDVALTNERWRRSMRTGESFEVEYRLKSSSGEYRWFLGKAEPLKDAAGLVLEWFGSCTDIHEQKTSQQTLRANEEQFRLMALAATDALWNWDLQANDIKWTAAVERLFNHDLEQANKGLQWWTEHLHPDEAERVITSLQTAIDSGAVSWQEEYRFRRSDGSYAYVLDRGHIMRDAQGKPLRMVGAIQDVSQQRLAEAALRQSQQELLSLLDELPQLVLLTCANGEVHWCNQAWARFTGSSAGQLRGEGWQQFLHPEHATRVQQSWGEWLDKAQLGEAVFPLRAADDHYEWFSLKAKPTLNPLGQLQRWMMTLTPALEPAQAQ
jgi:PAS domain S-box-containing protein